MANTPAFTNIFKQDLFNSAMTLGSDTIKLALYDSNAAFTKATVSYTATNEVGASGSYGAGGITMSGFTVSISSDTAYIDWTVDPAATTATITARGCIIYNDTHASDHVMGTFDFGGNKTSTAGTFTVTLPAAGASATFTMA